MVQPRGHPGWEEAGTRALAGAREAAELRGWAEARTQSAPAASAGALPVCLSASAPRGVQPCVRPGGMPGSDRLQRPRLAPRKLSPSDLGEAKGTRACPRSYPEFHGRLRVKTRPSGLAPVGWHPGSEALGDTEPFGESDESVGLALQKNARNACFAHTFMGRRDSPSHAYPFSTNCF